MPRSLEHVRLEATSAHVGPDDGPILLNRQDFPAEWAAGWGRLRSLKLFGFYHWLEGEWGAARQAAAWRATALQPVAMWRQAWTAARCFAGLPLASGSEASAGPRLC